MKQPMRFFAIGLFTAAILMFGYLSLFDQNTAIEKAPVEDVIAYVEEEGYRVITEEEFITFSLLDLDEAEVKDKQVDEKTKDEKQATNKKDENPSEKEDKKDEPKKDDEKKASSDKKDDSKKDSKKKKSKKVTITTGEGVVSEDIADMLYEKNVIKDKQKFQD